MVQAWDSSEVVVQNVQDKLQQIITINFSKGNQNEVLQLFPHMQAHSGNRYISKLKTWKIFLNNWNKELFIHHYSLYSTNTHLLANSYTHIQSP